MHLLQWIYRQRKISKLFEIIQYRACFQEGCRYFKTFTGQWDDDSSVLPVFSKTFEKLLQNQLVFFNNISSKFSAVSEKEYDTQSYSLMKLEFCKNVIHKNKSFGTFLTDLPKAWDCLHHDMLIAKLYVASLWLP